jgi:uncharacterized protein with GYD domain
MATYIVLANWTEQGVKTYPETTARAAAAGEAIERAGGKLTATWWTMGPYDFVGVMELPSDEAATALALRLGAQGNIRTTTMRAFSAAEMNAIIASASGA